MRISISTKISLLAIILVVLSSSFVGVHVYYESAYYLFNNIKKATALQLKLEKIIISSEIAFMRTDLNIVSRAPYMREYSNLRKNSGEWELKQKNKEYMQGIFLNLMKNRNYYMQFRLIDINNNGKEIVRVDRDGDNVFVVPENQLQEKGDRYYFLKAIDKKPGELYFSEIDINKEHGQLVVPYMATLRVATPLYDGENVIGILIINMRLNELFARIAKNFSEVGDFYMVNKTGDYLIHPDKNKTFGFDLGKKFKIQDDYKGMDKVLENTSLNWEEVSDFYYFTKGDKDFVFSKLNYNENDKSDFLGIGVEFNNKYVTAEEDHIRLETTIIVLSLIMGSVFITILFSNYLTRPLIHITDAAKSFAYGDFKAALPVDRDDEIGDLAKSLKSMSEQIDARTTDLEKFKEHLQEQVAERTVELRESLKKEELANKTKTEFLANISHEIVTPINGVVGLVNLLKNTKLTEKQEEYIDTIKLSTKSLLRIINDIMDFSKIELGKMTFDMAPFDFKEVVENVVTSFNASNKKEAVNLSLYWDEHANSCVVGDSVRLRQVVSNLVGNALKFTDQGYIKVSVQNLASKGDKHAYTVTVEDTGIGIPPEKLDYIFGKFNQIEDSSARRFEGIGLGLSICGELVKTMGGEIHVESRIGKGSKFWFTIFLTVSDKCIIQKLAGDEIEEKEHILEKCTGMNVLVVEDNRVNLIVMVELLNSYGCNVSTAINGFEAVEMFANNRFDIIFMDCRMPEMDGYEASQTIRRMERNLRVPEVPIIALTANAIEGDEDKCFASGMTHYIAKPVEEEKILSALNKWLPDKKII